MAGARVCRACLRAASPAARMTPLLQRCTATRTARLTPHARALMALAALTIEAGDGLPHQICPKCVLSLKQALHFKLMCERTHQKLIKLTKTNTNLKTDLIEYSMFSHHFPEYTKGTASNDTNISKNTAPTTDPSNNFRLSPKDFVFTLTPIKTTEGKVFADSIKNEQKTAESTEAQSDGDESLSDSSERIFDSMLLGIPEITTDLTPKPAEVKDPSDNLKLPRLVLKKARILEKDDDSRPRKPASRKNTSEEAERLERLSVKKARMKMANLRRLAKNQDKHKLTERQVSHLKRKLAHIESTKRKLNNIKKMRTQAVCKVCKKTFSSKGAVEMHSQQHYGYKFVCHICAKGTATNTALQRHLMNIHGLQKPFSCDLCSYKAVCKFQMKEHLRTHTGERPFTCDKCGLTFRRKAIWREHQHMHGEKRFKCERCPLSFYLRGQLNVHVNNVHQRQYVYRCSQPGCDTTYAKSTTVRRHLASAHGVPRAQQGRIARVNV